MVGWVIILIAVLAFLYAAYYFSTRVVYPRLYGVEESFAIEKENGRINEEEYNSWEKEEVLLQSPFGYQIYGLYFPGANAKRAVILSHGITYTRFGSVKYMKMFMDLGFNVFIYDNRYHGRSGGKNSTLGFYEKLDLWMITDWVEAKLGKGAIIGTHGESMGAAISLQHAAIDPRIQFVVEDCSFNRLEAMLAYRLKVDYHLPEFPFLPVVGLFCRILTGMSIKQVSPEDAVKKISAPILFIHGGKDAFIPPDMCEKLAALKLNGPKKLYMPPNAGHAELYWNNQKEYTAVVHEFLQENHIV